MKTMTMKTTDEPGQRVIPGAGYLEGEDDIAKLRKDLNQARSMCEGIRTKIHTQQQTLRTLLDEVDGIWTRLIEIGIRVSSKKDCNSGGGRQVRQ